MSENKIIRAAVIGVGYLGRFHAQKYAGIEGVELVAVVDANLEQAQAVADECSCKALSDYHELLTQVDIVSIVVPTSYHHQVAKDCLLAGLDVLLEKPMTVTVAEADDLNSIAETKSAILQIGHLERFNPAMIAMEPFLGQPVFIDSHRVAPFIVRATDVDVVLDLMIHDIDIILSIVGSPVASIHAIGSSLATKTNDLVNARLIFENGATANITTSRIATNTSRKMRIMQKNAILDVDFGNKECILTELIGETGQDCMPETKISNHTFAEADALKSEIIAFVSHVRDRTKPAVSGVEGRNALAIAQDIIAIVENNKKSAIFSA
ncbi:MAG: Gfo/Idh/MocA family oxidoreductase [Desulfotalea sp.]